MDVDELIQRLKTFPDNVLEGSGLCEEAAALETLRAELERKDAALDLASDQAYELSGVIIDTEQGYGFDDACLQTIKRVQGVLANLSQSVAQSQRLANENERLKTELEAARMDADKWQRESIYLEGLLDGAETDMRRFIEVRAARQQQG